MTRWIPAPHPSSSETWKEAVGCAKELLSEAEVAGPDLSSTERSVRPAVFAENIPCSLNSIPQFIIYICDQLHCFVFPPIKGVHFNISLCAEIIKPQPSLLSRVLHETAHHLFIHRPPLLASCVKHLPSSILLHTYTASWSISRARLLSQLLNRNQGTY